MRHKNADSKTQVHHEEKANPQDISDTGYEATCLQAKMGGLLSVVVVASKAVSLWLMTSLLTFLRDMYWDLRP